MSWTATMLGGPEDGRTFEGPADEPPAHLVIALQQPLFPDVDDVGTEFAPGYDRVVCLRERYSDGRWVYVWPTGATS